MGLIPVIEGGGEAGETNVVFRGGKAGEKVSGEAFFRELDCVAPCPGCCLEDDLVGVAVRWIN